MPKRKPKEVIVHRIELQEKERDLLELWLLSNQTNKLIESVVPSLGQLAGQLSNPINLYGFLTILELLDLLDTPLPTLADGNPLDKLKEWTTGRSANAERRDLNQEVQENLSEQAALSLKEAERKTKDARDRYYEEQNEGNKAALDAAQKEENRVRAEAKKRADIAKGWNWKFRYENGRNPRTYEIMAAKIRGEWYGPS